MEQMILSVDPGSTVSAYCLMRVKDYHPVKFGKVDNAEIIELIRFYGVKYQEQIHFVIEGVACYGMPVGKEVFLTCEYIGRFKQVAESFKMGVSVVYRKDVTLTLCHSARAGDTNVRRALIDKFAKHDFKNGKGQKKNPDFFYGFAADVWSAFALAYTHTILSGRAS